MGSAKGRGTGHDERGSPYWYINGAEVLGVVSADSTLARETHARIWRGAADDAVLEYPAAWLGFHCGKLDHALGALPFKITWVSVFHSLQLTPNYHFS